MPTDQTLIYFFGGLIGVVLCLIGTACALFGRAKDRREKRLSKKEKGTKYSVTSVLPDTEWIRKIHEK
jgi:nitrate reductase gamma subunit